MTEPTKESVMPLAGNRRNAPTTSWQSAIQPHSGMIRQQEQQRGPSATEDEPRELVATLGKFTRKYNLKSSKGKAQPLIRQFSHTRPRGGSHLNLSTEPRTSSSSASEEPPPPPPSSPSNAKSQGLPNFPPSIESVRSHRGRHQRKRSNQFCCEIIPSWFAIFFIIWELAAAALHAYFLIEQLDYLKDNVRDAPLVAPIMHIVGIVLNIFTLIALVVVIIALTTYKRILLVPPLVIFFFRLVYAFIFCGFQLLGECSWKPIHNPTWENSMNCHYTQKMQQSQKELRIVGGILSVLDVWVTMQSFVIFILVTMWYEPSVACSLREDQRESKIRCQYCSKVSSGGRSSRSQERKGSLNLMGPNVTPAYPVTADATAGRRSMPDSRQSLSGTSDKPNTPTLKGREPSLPTSVQSEPLPNSLANPVYDRAAKSAPADVPLAQRKDDLPLAEKEISRYQVVYDPAEADVEIIEVEPPPKSKRSVLSRLASYFAKT